MTTINPIPPGAGQGPALPTPPAIIPVNTAPPGKIKGKPVAVKPAPPKKAPAPPKSALDKWLAGDTTYQQQVADLNREQSAYQANTNRTNQKQQRDFSSTERQMNTQGTTDRSNQQYDFAGRGILHSGVYAKALADYNTDFSTKLNNLIQGNTDTKQQTASDLADFLRQIALQKTSAKQDAIRRRQQSLGI